jgi:hypothetical protein
MHDGEHLREIDIYCEAFEIQQLTGIHRREKERIDIGAMSFE